MYREIAIFFWFASTILAGEADHLHGIHLPIFRRTGRFTNHQLANITRLSQTLSILEKKYARTTSRVDGNRIVRQWRDEQHDSDNWMLNEAGLDGGWYAKLQVGQPSQTLEVDIDMLSPDFYTIMTTSGEGSKYDTFASNTHEPSNFFSHPACQDTSDIFTWSPFSSRPSQHRLTLPVCQAGKYTHHTLYRSGTILGLSPGAGPGPGPARSLSRLPSASLLDQLLEHKAISYPLMSLTLLTSTTGLLSLGGTIAPQIEEAKIRVDKSLQYLDRLTHDAAATADAAQALEAEIAGALAFAVPPGSTHEAHFKWSGAGTDGVGGWHTTLATGVWVHGVKVLRNQPVVLDVNCPFVLAPPGAASAVYVGIPGAKSMRSLLSKGYEHKHKLDRDLDLEDGHNQTGERGGERERQREREEEENGFYAFPCLNEVNVEFELAGWRFPLARGGLREDVLHGPAGGAFSLGKVDMTSGVPLRRGNSVTAAEGEGRENEEAAIGTGYCVGIIVESAMGLRKEWERSLMRDVWVLGEPFFRGMGVAFDMSGEKGKAARIGFRIY